MKDAVREREVSIDAVADAHPQPTEHDRDEPGWSAWTSTAYCVCESSPASTRTPNHIKVVAWFRRRLWIDGLHQPLKDHERRQASDTTTVKREQAEVVAWHSLLRPSRDWQLLLICVAYHL